MAEQLCQTACEYSTKDAQMPVSVNNTTTIKTNISTTTTDTALVPINIKPFFCCSFCSYFIFTYKDGIEPDGGKGVGQGLLV